MSKSVFVYMAMPLHSKRHSEYCRALYTMGYVPICPNLMFSFFNETPEQRQSRHTMSLAMLRRCRALVVCGETIDEEMEAAIMLANRLNIVSTTLASIEKIAMYSKKDTAENV